MQVKLEVVVSGENLKNIILEHIELLDDIAASVDSDVWNRWHRIRFPIAGNCCPDLNNSPLNKENDTQHQVVSYRRSHQSPENVPEVGTGNHPETSVIENSGCWGINQAGIKEEPLQYHDSDTNSEISQSMNVDSCRSEVNVIKCEPFDEDELIEGSSVNPWCERADSPTMFYENYPITRQTLNASRCVAPGIARKTPQNETRGRRVYSDDDYAQADSTSASSKRLKRTQTTGDGAVHSSYDRNFNSNSNYAITNTTSRMPYSNLMRPPRVVVNTSQMNTVDTRSVATAASSKTSQRLQGQHSSDISSSATASATSTTTTTTTTTSSCKSKLREILNQKSQSKTPTMASLIMKEILLKMTNDEDLQQQQQQQRYQKPPLTPPASSSSNSVLRTLLNS
ncbi:uncharacterized protein LOC141906308 [Tubulanus polymorphus]|uniref:uncharacterized protein LOC141906308 n=1 Tax=Tubulanus polymorphus TaxID=672921 RepID=UPI003DA289D4